jgi:hypothetical protein
MTRLMRHAWIYGLSALRLDGSTMFPAVPIVWGNSNSKVTPHNGYRRQHTAVSLNAYNSILMKSPRIVLTPCDSNNMKIPTEVGNLTNLGMWKGSHSLVGDTHDLDKKNGQVEHAPLQPLIETNEADYDESLEDSIFNCIWETNRLRTTRVEKCF